MVGKVPGLFGKIFDTLDAVNAPDIRYFKNKIIQVLRVMNIKVNSTFKDPVLDTDIDIGHIDFKFRRYNICQVIHHPDPVDTCHADPCKKGNKLMDRPPYCNDPVSFI